MTERMRDAFIVRDVNGQRNMIPSQNERPMAMGDGTFMSEDAFKDSIPMMSYTPEELGINMSAYPTAPAQEESAFEIAMQNKTQTSEKNPMSPMEEAIVQSSANPYLAVVQQDEVDGGVQFNSDWVKDNSFDILRGLVLIGIGVWLGKNYL